MKKSLRRRGGVGRAARQARIPVIAIVGSAGEGADESLQVLDAYHALVDETTLPEEAMARAASLLERRTAQVMRVYIRFIKRICKHAPAS